MSHQLPVLVVVVTVLIADAVVSAVAVVDVVVIIAAVVVVDVLVGVLVDVVVDVDFVLQDANTRDIVIRQLKIKNTAFPFIYFSPFYLNCIPLFQSSSETHTQ